MQPTKWHLLGLHFFFVPPLGFIKIHYNENIQCVRFLIRVIKWNSWCSTAAVFLSGYYPLILSWIPLILSYSRSLVSLILSAGLKLQLQCSLLHELSIVSYTLQSWSLHLHCDQTLNQLDKKRQDFLDSLKILESSESQWEKIAQMGVSHRKTAASYRAMQPEIQLRNTAAKYNW